jgi:methylmalonyl-CoA carboxyltransferase large subunit
MTTEAMDWARVCQNLEALRQEVGRLGERVTALERNAERIGQDEKETNRPAEEPLSEELIAVLGAAVAAFLGKKAPIRQVRLLGSTAWSQQGRVIIQASHTR